MVTVAPMFPAGINELTVVSPVVCILNTDPDSLKLRACEREVDCVYWMPVDIFLENEAMETLKMHFPLATKTVYHSSPGFRFNSIETGRSHFVWGLTARICLTLSAIALNRTPAYPYSSNVAISSIWREGSRLRLDMHCIPLTRGQRDKWKDCSYKVTPNLLSDKWAVSDRNSSKL